MNTSRLAKGYPHMLTSIVAEAAMQLPPIVEEKQFDFLRTIFTQVQIIFFMNLVSTLEYGTQQEVQGILERNDAKEMDEWVAKNVDLTNPEIAKKAEIVLDDLAEKLPGIMKESYDAYMASPT